MRIKRIKLKSLKNTRDLGGFEGADGKRIASHKLIRSGHLSGASCRDISILTDEYNLRYVIDLRTDAEIHEKPEVLPELVTTFSMPLLDNSFLGIARDEYSIRSWFNVFENSDSDPVDIFCQMYEMLVFGDRSKAYIRKIFDVLLEADGAVLWHCSAGKDRVGIVTMLVLLALGVDRNTIIDDYIATKFFTARSIISTCFLGSLVYRTKRIRKCLFVLMGVKRLYAERIFAKIDADFESVNDFFYRQYGITADEIEKLRNKYLI